MTDLERWIDGDAPEDVAALLRAARAEAPSGAALERALVGAAAGATALGTAAAAAAAEGSTAAGVVGAAIGSGATGAAAAGATGGALSIAALAKPLLGGLLAGTVFCTAVTVVRSPPPVAAPPAAVAPADAPAVLASSLPVGAKAPLALEASGGEPPPAPPSSPGASAASPPEDAALQAEVSLVDGVRRALDAGDHDVAMFLLDRHLREHGDSGRLAPEARALRLEALTRLGRKGEARAVAREILARDRGTPHQAKAEAALGERGPAGSAIDADPGSGALPPTPTQNP